MQLSCRFFFFTRQLLFETLIHSSFRFLIFQFLFHCSLTLFFQILDLPISRSSSQSASTTSTTTSSPTPQSPTSNVSALDPYHSHNHHHVHRVVYVSSSPHKANKKPPTTPQSDGSSKSDCYHQDVWVHGDECS